ncbi:MAG: DUF4116 domain-containing protein [Legionella sp.]
MLTTTKIYQLVSLEDYIVEKNNYLLGIDNHYANKSVLEKWTILINKYSQIAPIVAQQLEFFKKTRESTTPTNTNLSLDSCVHYFEDFCFLLETTNSKFAITDSDKECIHKSIAEVNFICETGLITRFERIIQLYRKDIQNWVASCLYKQRYNLVAMMHVQYNSQYHVAESRSVHTLNMMLELAAEKNLGISIEQQLVDVYRTNQEADSITDYFNQHYPLATIKYKYSMVDLLTEHLMAEVARLDSTEQPQWSNNHGLYIPGDQGAVFVNLIEEHLGFKYIEANPNPNSELIVYQLMTVDEEKLDGSILLHDKKIFYSRLYNLIYQKLVQEQYIIHINQTDSIDTIFKKLAQASELSNTDLRLLAALSRAVQRINLLGKNKVSEQLAEFQHLICKVPAAILWYLKENPVLWNVMPLAIFKNMAFSEQAINAFNEILIRGLSEPNDTLTHLSITYLSHILVEHPSFYEKLSDEAKNNKQLILNFILRHPQSYVNLPDHLKLDIDIAKRAIQGNKFIYFNLPEQLKQQFDNENIKIEEEEFNLYQQDVVLNRTMRAISGTSTDINLAEQNPTLYRLWYSLLTKNVLSVNEVIKCSHALSPNALIIVNNYRRDCVKASLPYWPFGNLKELSSTIQRLLAVNSEKDDYLSIKKKATIYLSILDQNDEFFQLIYNVAHCNSWYEFFIYQKYQDKCKSSSFYHLYKLFISLLESICNLLIKNLKILFGFTIWFSLGILSYVYLVNLSSQYSFYRCWFYLSMAFRFMIQLSNLDQDKGLAILINLPYCLLTFPWRIIFILFHNVLVGAWQLVSCVSRVWDNLVSIYSQLNFMFSQKEYLTSETTISMKTLLQNCMDSIIRLNLIASPSALEKANVLQNILAQITKELTLAENSADEAMDAKAYLVQLLDKPYAIEHHSKEYRLSFKQVAAMRRTNDYSFDLSPGLRQSIQNFFFKKPTTMKFLNMDQPFEFETGLDPLFLTV